jgi:hypothetical protein
MNTIKSAAQLMIFSRYIGQRVVMRTLSVDDEETVGTLAGIKQNALLITVDDINRWVPLSDEIKLCEIKLLLKPLKRLTAPIIDTANNLPVQAFITPYYQSLGFDMPVFIAPGHPCNCKYVHELELADYRAEEEITRKSKPVLMVIR